MMAPVSLARAVVGVKQRFRKLDHSGPVSRVNDGNEQTRSFTLQGAIHNRDDAILQSDNMALRKVGTAARGNCGAVVSSGMGIRFLVVRQRRLHVEPTIHNWRTPRNTDSGS